MHTRRRALTLLAPALLLGTLPACSSVTVNEHRAGSAAPSVAVKALWQDEDGERHLVAGVSCRLTRKGGEDVASGVTTTEAPLVFPDLEPGTYVLFASGGEVRTQSAEFELSERRRITLRIDVDASRHGEPSAADGVLKVLVGGVLVALVALGFAVGFAAD